MGRACAVGVGGYVGDCIHVKRDPRKEADNMNKLLMAFLLLFFVGSFLDYIVNGGGGFTTTQLREDVTASAEVIYCYDVSKFHKQGLVQIGDEFIEYKNKSDIDNTLFKLDRGEDDTVAEAHSKFENVYSEDAAAINKSLGFSITNIASNGGVLAFPIIAWNFVYHTLPKLILFDFSFLNFGPLIWFRYFMMLFSIGLIFMIFHFIFIALGSAGNALLSLGRGRF